MKNNIKKIIKEKGFTQKELAQMLKINVNTVSGWVKGTIIPKLDNAYELSKVLECKIDDLISDEEQEAPSEALPIGEEEALTNLFTGLSLQEKRTLINLARDYQAIMSSNETPGNRTPDNLIKSQVLYRLS